MLLHELAHVEARERLLVVEEELGERLGELGLADAARAEEEERADRLAGIAQADAAAAHRLGDRAHRLVLTDDALRERSSILRSFSASPSSILRDGDAGPVATTSATSSSSDDVANEERAERGDRGARRLELLHEVGDRLLHELGAKVLGEALVRRGDAGLFELALDARDVLGRAPLRIPRGAERLRFLALPVHLAFDACVRGGGVASVSFSRERASMPSASILRSSTSSSVGIESRSTRTRAAASSIRSTALFGSDTPCT